jgi:hypothetical protein
VAVAAEIDGKREFHGVTLVELNDVKRIRRGDYTKLFLYFNTVRFVIRVPVKKSRKETGGLTAVPPRPDQP